MLTLYLRRVPISDHTYAAHTPEGAKKLWDVEAYADKEATKPKARWLWWNSTRPRRNARWIWLNCAKYRAEWIADHPELGKVPALT